MVRLCTSEAASIISIRPQATRLPVLVVELVDRLVQNKGAAVRSGEDVEARAARQLGVPKRPDERDVFYGRQQSLVSDLTSLDQVESRTDNRVDIDPKVAIQIRDVTCLTEVIDTERSRRDTVYGPEEGQRMGVTVVHRDDRCRSILGEEHVENSTVSVSQSLSHLERPEDEVCRGETNHLTRDAEVDEAVCRCEHLWEHHSHAGL